MPILGLGCVASAAAVSNAPIQVVWLQLLMSLCSHTRSRKWARMSQSLRQFGIRIPTSLSGARAASTTLIYTWGDRGSPKGRTLYCYAQPSKANCRNGLYWGKFKTWKYSSFHVHHCKRLGSTCRDCFPRWLLSVYTKVDCLYKVSSY